MSQVQITKRMLDELEYDTQQKMSLQSNTTASSSAVAMFVFAGADLNAAAYHLVQSLHGATEQRVATVLVQESVQADFIAKVQPQLKALSAEICQQANYASALAAIERLNAKTLTASSVTPAQSPTLVYDVTQDQLGATSPTIGIATLHTFRTAKESIAIFAKESSIVFTGTSIWHANYSCAYELVAALGCPKFWVNCFQVPLAASVATAAAAGSNSVYMDKSYHYETISHEGVQKSVVFPIGTIFAN